MATDASKVLVGTPDQKVTGAIMSAPLGTPLPQTIDDQLDQAFIDGDSGYVSSDGLTLTPDASTNDINEWGGALVRRLLESFNGTIAWSYIQTDLDSLRNAFGDNNVEVTAPATAEHGEQIRVSIGARLPERKSWIFRMKDGNARMMIVAPDAQPTSWEDITFAATDAVSWPVSLATYPDASGNSLYILLDDGRTIGVATVHPSGVTVTPATASVEEGKTVRLAADVQPATATDKTVTWSSDHPEIAGVSDTGLVTGVKAGTARITATTANGLTASCDVTVTGATPVNVPVTGIDLTPETMQVEEGKDVALNVAFTPANATDQAYTVESSVEENATATSNGLTVTVHGVKAGESTISITSHDGGKKATSRVTVTAPKPVVVTKAYHGTADNNTAATFTADFIKGLTGVEVSADSVKADYDYTPDATANNGDGQYLVFALPASYAKPKFTSSGFTFPFTKTATVDVDGVSTDVYTSDNMATVNVTITIG